MLIVFGEFFQMGHGRKQLTHRNFVGTCFGNKKDLLNSLMLIKILKLRIMKRLFVVLGCLVFLGACESKKEYTYEYHSIFNGGLRTWQHEFDLSLLSKLESKRHYYIGGRYNDTLYAGNLREGQNLGTWKYKVNRAMGFEMEWDIVADQSGELSFSMPASWEEKKDSKEAFEARYQSEDPTVEDVFVIKRFKKNGTKVDLNNYFSRYRNQLRGEHVVSHESGYLFKRAKRSHYFLNYIVSVNTNKFSNYLIIAETQDELLELHLSSGVKGMDKNFITMLELLKTLKVNGESVYSGYEGPTEVLRLD